MKKNQIRTPLLAAVLVAFALSAPLSVRANMLTIDLNRSNVGNLLPDRELYGTVEVFDNVGNADADALVSGSDIAFRVSVFTTLDDPSALLTPGTNFGIEKFTFNDAGGLATGFVGLPSGWGQTTNRNGDGFGLFDYLVSTPRPPPGGVHRMDPLIFGVIAAGASLSDFISLSTGGRSSPFAAHIAGFLDVDPTYNNVVTSAWFGVVPIPAAVWLFLSGLGLLGIFKHRHRMAATA